MAPADLTAGDSFVLAVITAVLLSALLVKTCSPGAPRERDCWMAVGFDVASPVVVKATAIDERLGPRWASVTNLVLVLSLLAELLVLYGILGAGPGEAAPFDPHEALGIDSSSNITEVKAAYRQLARVYHPDKNPDPAARARFSAIIKAHAILTDPVAASNFRKFGSPDGYQGFAYGMGLPAWMLDEAALLPALMLVLGVPLIALCCMRDNGDPQAKRAAKIGEVASEHYREALKRSGAKAVREHLVQLAASAYAAADTSETALSDEQRRALLQLQPKASAAGAVPTVAASRGDVPGGSREGTEAEADCAEGETGGGKARKRKKGKGGGGGEREGGNGDAAIAKGSRSPLAEQALELAAMESSAARAKAQVGAGAAAGASEKVSMDTAFEWLLLAHLQRLPVPLELQKPLQNLLLYMPTILEAFFMEAVLEHSLGFAECVRPVLSLAQSLHQALPPRGAGTPLLQLLQLPCVDPACAARLLCASFRQGEDAQEDAPKSLADFVSMERHARDALLVRAGLEGGSARSDVHAFCERVFPRATLTVNFAGVKDEEGPPREGDLLTVEATLHLAHRESGARSGALPAASCHAPLFPHQKPEAWMLLLVEGDEGGVEGKGGGVRAICAAPKEWTKWKAPLRAPAAVTKGAGKAKDKKSGVQWTGVMRTRVRAADELKLEVHAVCLSYAGCDALQTVTLQVVREDDTDDEYGEDGEDGEGEGEGEEEEEEEEELWVEEDEADADEGMEGLD
jgi:curved DNA-binding protein CbpA